MHDPGLAVSLSTLIPAARILGYELEDRTSVREAQDRSLVAHLQAASTAPLAGDTAAEAFVVGALDVLVTQEDGHNRFHIIELNGSGLGGLTNMDALAVRAVLQELTRLGAAMDAEEPLVLIAVAGNDKPPGTARSHLIYEKLLMTDALCAGLRQGQGAARVDTLAHLLERGSWDGHRGPTVMLGFGPEFLRQIDTGGDALRLHGRPVSCVVNDRLAMRLRARMGPAFERACKSINGSFVVTTDKGATYAYLNDFLATRPYARVARNEGFVRAHGRDALITEVLRLTHAGRRVLIKPQSSGRGKGIEFFLAEEPDEVVVARVDASLDDIADLNPGRSLPYTVCDFVDARTVAAPAHRFHGHKFELRVVVYKDGAALKAYPSIVKVCPVPYDAASPSREMLINNISASTDDPQVARLPGTARMLPLASRETLALLGLGLDEVEELCHFAAAFVRHCVEQPTRNPAWCAAIADAAWHVEGPAGPPVGQAT